MITYNEITENVKKNNKKINVKIDTNKFEQSYFIPKTEVPKVSNTDIDNINLQNKKPVQKSAPKIENIINYKENEIISLPINTNKYLDKNSFYTYGVSKDNSILKSVLFVIDNDYKLASDLDKKTMLNEFICLLNSELNKSFKEYNLASYNVKKINIQKQLSNYSLDDTCAIYISKYLKINLVIIDPYDETYEIFDEVKKENNNIILIKYINNNVKIFIPLLHIYGKLPDNSVLEDIFNSLKCKTGIKTNVNLNENVNENANENSNENSNELKPIKSYNLQEIQKLAIENNINLYSESDGKKKKKTKNIIYTELLDIYSK